MTMVTCVVTVSWDSERGSTAPHLLTQVAKTEPDHMPQRRAPRLMVERLHQ
jgi:hypothetical protein